MGMCIFIDAPGNVFLANLLSNPKKQIPDAKGTKTSRRPHEKSFLTHPTVREWPSPPLLPLAHAQAQLQREVAELQGQLEQEKRETCMVSSFPQLIRRAGIVLTQVVVFVSWVVSIGIETRASGYFFSGTIFLWKRRKTTKQKERRDIPEKAQHQLS